MNQYSSWFDEHGKHLAWNQVNFQGSLVMTTRLWAYFLSKKLQVIFALVEFLDFRPPLFVVA
jgi:hypothetical protein